MALADLLLEKEVIFKNDLETIFGKRPFETTEDEDTDTEETKNENSSETAE